MKHNISTPPTKTHADPPGRSPTMEEEREKLRQRGLTKSLNKHFAQQCKQIQMELVASESALLELETRKANIQKFAPDSNEIENLDMMCTKVAEWKKQCRKNEQEIVLLYQSYVQKFAGSVTLAMPDELMNNNSDPPVCSSSSMIANAEISTLVEAFEKAQSESGGIPDFLRPKEALRSAPFNTKRLCEIIEEDASLPDPDAPCKTLAATPTKDVTDTIDSDVDDSSIVSGLTTLNSAVTREVLHDVDKNVMDFIKKETETIRKMMEEDDASKAALSIASRKSSSSVAEHENMVKKMQQVLDDFKKAEEEAKKKEKSTAIRRLDGVGGHGEEWFEHYDETFMRPFYVEAKTNKTQWHPPQAHADVSVAETSLSESYNSGKYSSFSATPTKDVPSYEEFIPQQGRRKTRVEAYRAKRRRQRKRQLVTLTAALCVLGAGVMYYKQYNPEKVEQVLETVVDVIGLSGSSSDAVVEPPKTTNNKDKSVPSGAPALLSEKKTGTPTSSTPSVPVNTKKTVPKKTEDVPDEPIVRVNEEKLEAPPEQADNSSGPFQRKDEFKVDTTEKPKGLAFTKPLVRQNWLLDVFFGAPAFQIVNQQCRNQERYCGLYHY